MFCPKCPHKTLMIEASDYDKRGEYHYAEDEFTDYYESTFACPECNTIVMTKMPVAITWGELDGNN